MKTFTQKFALLLISGFSIPALAMLPNPQTPLTPLNAMPPALAISKAPHMANPSFINPNQINNNQTNNSQANSQTNSSTLSDSQNQVGQAVYAYLVRGVAGQEQLIPIDAATSINRGDIVEYHGHFTNKTADRIGAMTAMMDIPTKLELISTEPLAFASVDSKRFSAMPLRTLVNGQLVPVPLAYYRAIRFDIKNIGIGATAVVKYRAKIR